MSFSQNSNNKIHAFLTFSRRAVKRLSLFLHVHYSGSGGLDVTLISNVSASMVKITFFFLGSAFIFVMVQIFNKSLRWFCSVQSSQQGADCWGDPCVCVCVSH